MFQKKTFALLEERDWSNIAVSHRPTRINADVKKSSSRELNLNVNLPAGLGLSIVSQRPVEELLFARLAGISLDLLQTPLNTILDLNVVDVQIDNQLFEAQCTSVLFVTRPSPIEDENRPALQIAAEKQQSKNQNAEIYKHVIVSVKPLCVHLEEKFILKLAAFLGSSKSELDMPVDENDFKAQRIISEVSAAHAKRYYFGALKLVPNQVTNVKVNLFAVSSRDMNNISKLQFIRTHVLGKTQCSHHNKVTATSASCKEKIGFDFNQFRKCHYRARAVYQETSFRKQPILGAFHYETLQRCTLYQTRSSPHIYIYYLVNILFCFRN